MPAECGCRTLIIAAHQDDETIGVGGLLPTLPEVVIVHVTDGAPRNTADALAAGFRDSTAYATARRVEMLAAIALAGIAPERTRELGITDQEAGMHLGEIAGKIASLIRELRPEIIYTHPYEGGHPDHDATAFAVHTACRMVARPPALIEFTSYHAHEGRMATGEFLPGGGPVTENRLPDAAVRRKRAMFGCFRSQAHMLRNFEIGIERFRPAPEYDFTAPPHAGTLFYEQFEWGMTGERFRALATRALAEIATGATL